MADDHVTCPYCRWMGDSQHIHHGVEKICTYVIVDQWTVFLIFQLFPAKLRIKLLGIGMGVGLCNNAVLPL